MARMIPEWRGRPYSTNNPKDMEEYNRLQSANEAAGFIGGIFVTIISLIFIVFLMIVG